MKERRISVALDGMLLGGPFSGVEEAILGLAQTQATTGRHEYRFFLPSCCQHMAPSGPHFRSQGVPIPRSRLARILWEQVRLPRQAKKENCDLIHAPAYLAPLTATIPVVLTVYDLQALLHPELCMPLNRVNYRMMMPPSIRKARGIIVPSQSVESDLIRLFPNARDKTTVIPIGLNPHFRISDSTSHQEALALYKISDPFILFVGNMAANKNVPALVRAFGHMKRDHGITHKLVLAGRHISHYRKVRQAIRTEGLAEEVISTGYVPEDRLVSLYNEADIFVFPSVYEGFGLPPLEAMACGTPVVCSNADGLSDTVGNAAAFADPEDATALAAAISALLNDQGRQTELRHLGIERAKAFTRENAMLQTETFYEKIISSE